MDDISLQQFTAMDQATNVASYVHTLEAFDDIEQLQELKVIARQRGHVRHCRTFAAGMLVGAPASRSAARR
jgi:hypothetical protein